jgi:uncharacterized protein (TIRG00374 family)
MARTICSFTEFFRTASLLPESLRNDPRGPAVYSRIHSLTAPANGQARRIPLPLIIVGKVVLAAALLAFVLSKVNLLEVARRLAGTLSPSLVLASALALIIPCVLACRWWILGRPVIGILDAVAFTWIGSFYALILPGAVSGDIAKGGLLAWRKTDARTAILPASILADRLVGLAIMLVFFSVSSALVAFTAASPELVRFARPAFVVGIVMFGVLAAAWTPPFQRLALSAIKLLPWKSAKSRFQSFVEATFAYSGQPLRIIYAAALSVLSQALSVGMYLALLSALGVKLGLIPAFALYSIIAVLGLAPVTFAGIGLRDWFSVGFFAAYHLPPETGVAFAWLCLATGVLQAVIGGVWQLALAASRPKNRSSAL